MSEEEARKVIENYFTYYRDENPELALAVSIVLKALEKKDIIIEEMTKTIIKLREDSENDCFIPKSYRDINGCIETTCDICIKEYFIKLVEDK